MRPQHDAAIEAQNEVLADRVDCLEAAAVQHGCVDRSLRTRVRRLRLDDLADEDLKPPRGEMERVALWHRATVARSHGRRRGCRVCALPAPGPAAAPVTRSRL